ncbi:hypothetical protein CBS470a_003942 [Colletotrichum nupharicola]|nr:hypothetical protein CBS470a_003942 [Colletotrichum nupharicola]
MRSTTLLVVALTTLASGVNGVRAAANLCFFPGGVQSLDVPCDPKAEVSMCCGSVNACLSNGLCKLEDTSNNTGIAYARGTYPDTRKNNSAFDFRFNGVQVWQCDSQGFATPGKFCCESAAEKTRCCSTPAAIFGPLIAATPGNAAAVQTLNTNSKSTPTQSASGSHKTGGTAAEATGPGHTPAITSAPTMTSKIPASTPAAGSGTGATTGETTSGTTEKQGLSTVATVGMGVGASVGGALLVAVGVMWWMRKERRERGPVELDGSSVYGAGGNGGDLSRANSGRIAYGGMNVGNGTGTISSMGTGTYVNGMGTMGGRRASSEWDGSPGGLGGSYQMAEIDGKEALVVGEPKGRKKSLYELP